MTAAVHPGTNRRPKPIVTDRPAADVARHDLLAYLRPTAKAPSEDFLSRLVIAFKSFKLKLLNAANDNDQP